MNAPQQNLPSPPAPAAPATPSVPEPIHRRRADQAFLPAALEVLDTPPSPIRLALLVAICALFAIALVWSWIGRIDVVAVAPGRIQPTGRVKAVQAAETGRVVAVNVQNGNTVAAGDVLIVLDPREAEADEAELATGLASARAEAIRRQAALDAARESHPAIPTIDWGDEIPEMIRAREARVLDGDIGRLAADLAALDAQRTLKEAEIQRLETTIAAQEQLVATQGVRVDMRTELINRDAGSKAQLIDAQEVRQLQQVTLAQQKGQLGEARAALDWIARERSRILETFTADNGQKLADVESRVDDLGQRLAKAKARLEQMTIAAPIAGTVTALAVGGAGQVVTTGQEVLRIVPDGSKLELEAYISNRDIGFIHPGQPVAIKIESFPFTRYGMLEGTVAQVAHDAVAEGEVLRQIASPTASSRSTGPGGTQDMQGLVFPVIVTLPNPRIAADGINLPLVPGMAATAEIKTGSRRMLEYLFSPLVEVGSEAMKER